MTDIASALDGLLNDHATPLDEIVARHFTDGYRQRTDGSWSDRTEFIAHIAHLRSLVTHADIQVHDELCDDRRYADRHIARLTKRDGSTVTQEVYLFGTLSADGRFERIEETTLMLAGNESDRGIGSAR